MGQDFGMDLAWLHFFLLQMRRVRQTKMKGFSRPPTKGVRVVKPAPAFTPGASNHTTPPPSVTVSRLMFFLPQVFRVPKLLHVLNYPLEIPRYFASFFKSIQTFFFPHFLPGESLALFLPFMLPMTNVILLSF